jgi:nucleoside-diphosphate-sugar epimerase
METMGVAGKNILITGATGFVGYHLAKTLVISNDVYCIVRPHSNLEKLKKLNNVKFIYYDGTIQSILNTLEKIYIDITFHLASLAIADHTEFQVDDLIQSNVLFPTQLLEALTLNHSFNFINTGSFWQNYTHSDYDPTCLYAATKESFEDIINYYYAVKNLSCVTLRLYDTYGPDDERKKLFRLLDELRITGKELAMSPGEQRLNLVYIDDVVNAYIWAAELILNKLKVNLVYGVYTNQDYSLQEVVSLYETIHDCKLKINWGQRPYRAREVMQPQYLYSPIPQWKPLVGLEKGIKSIR